MSPAPFGRPGFDPTLAGKRAECDGGMVGEDASIGREELAGTLTGDYLEHGEPPSRWYLMTRLTRKPPNLGRDAVWCERSFLYVLE